MALIALMSVLVTVPAFAKTLYKNWQNGRLIIELTPALCQSSLSYRKYSQCKELRPYVIGGLDMGEFDMGEFDMGEFDMGEFDISKLDLKKRSMCHYYSVPTLPVLQARVVNRLIPDRNQQIDIWHQYGACSNINMKDYFRQIIQQSRELKLPKVIKMGNTVTIKTTNLVQELKNNNINLSHDSIQLSCQGEKDNLPILTKIAICYQNGRYGQCQSKVESACGDTVVVLGW